MVVERDLLKVSEERWAELAKAAGWKVGALAKAVKCSAKQLGRFFKKHKGAGTRQWMMLLRIRNAAEELKTEAVKNVSGNAGYAAPSQFCRAFKSFYGVTPTEAALGALDSVDKRQAARSGNGGTINPPIRLTQPAGEPGRCSS